MSISSFGNPITLLISSVSEFFSLNAIIESFLGWLIIIFDQLVVSLYSLILEPILYHHLLK